MRVLQLSWEYPPAVEGGLGRHVEMLCRHLTGESVEVDAVVRGTEAAGGVDRDGAVRVHRMPAAPFPYELDPFLDWVEALNRGLATLASAVVARRRPDLVHGHDWLVAGAARATAHRAGVPWVTTVHATEHGRHGGHVQQPPQSTIHAAEQAMVREADHVVTCSGWMRDHVAHVFGIPLDRITATRNGVDVDRVMRSAGDPVSWRERLVPDGGPLVMLVGRLVHEKGFDVALEALAGIDGVRCAIAGAGPAEAQLRALVASRASLGDRVTFLGRLADGDLHALYHAADVCVVPSRYEPFGIVALEALASGCPCIVSDTGGLRDIVPAGESVGLLVAPRDGVALAGALRRLIGNPALRARMAAAGPAHARRHDWPAVAAQTSRVYDAVLAGSTPGPASSPSTPSPASSPSTRGPASSASTACS